MNSISFDLVKVEVKVSSAKKANSFMSSLRFENIFFSFLGLLLVFAAAAAAMALLALLTITFLCRDLAGILLVIGTGGWGDVIVACIIWFAARVTNQKAAAATKNAQ